MSTTNHISISLSPKGTLAAQEALIAYNKLTALNPSSSESYVLKGSLLQQLSRHQEAIDAFTQAIKINPEAGFYSARSVSYCTVGDEKKAEADMKSAKKLGYNPQLELGYSLQSFNENLSVCP